MRSSTGKVNEFLLAGIALCVVVNQAGYLGEQHSHGLAAPGPDVVAPDGREQERALARSFHAPFFATTRVSDAVRRCRTTWDRRR